MQIDNGVEGAVDDASPARVREAQEELGRLIPAEVLDVRPRKTFEAHPTRRAANIPLAELRQNPFELPATGSAVAVAETGQEAAEAAHELAQMGRPSRLVPALPGEQSADRFRLWRASTLLEESRAMPRSSALCLACGVGREAVVLAAEGWRVTAIDILPDAIERGRRLEHVYRPAGTPAIRWLCADLRRPLPLELGEFVLITQFFFSDPTRVVRTANHLAAGGVALFEVFSEQHWLALGRLSPIGNPRQEDWTEAFEVQQTEGWHDARHTTRVVVRKPDDTRVPRD